MGTKPAATAAPRPSPSLYPQTNLFTGRPWLVAACVAGAGALYLALKRRR